MRIPNYLLFWMLAFAFLGRTTQAQVTYQDKPYWQDYSVKYYADPATGPLSAVCSDRNGAIKVLAAKSGILHPYAGQLLYPGTLPPDPSYRTIRDRKLAAIGVYDDQIVYLDDKAVLSNAWVGKLYLEHQLPNARLFAGGQHFMFLLSDGNALQLVAPDKSGWKGALPGDDVVGIQFQPERDQFWVLGKRALYTLPAANPKLTKVLDGANFTAFALTNKGQIIIIGTSDGYLEFDAVNKKQVGAMHKNLPWPQITAVAQIDNKLWFGSAKGAFALRPDGKFDYYYGERWLPGNEVVGLAKGRSNSVLILTNAGLGEICFKAMTLAEKAQFFEEQVRSRHIRNGFNASLSGMERGNLASGFLDDSDNDGLWTSMYLAGEVFRYAVTKEPDALRNCRESLDAMERLYTINPVAGFPARSFERSGYLKELADPDRWQHSPQTGWDWKSTTSSDEAIGHVFAFGAMAELTTDKALRSRAITLIDTLMSHIVRHDLYLVDFDGKPTTWGRWNPEYVNKFPTNVGDRKLNSSNIIGMLQTAYHFTKKEKYKQKALELMQKHGYLQNLMRPMSQIGQAGGSDTLSNELSEEWNHSDDEMYFLGYWGLYRYAFNDTLKAQYKKAIIDHWQAERPEKEGAWNLFTAITGVRDFDLNEAVWYLREHPMDLIDWPVANSHRKDIEHLPTNFRGQATREVLPPDERPTQRHNANMFILDRPKANGTSEHSAGDIWVLPYWLGRYLGVISAPVSK